MKIIFFIFFIFFNSECFSQTQSYCKSVVHQQNSAILENFLRLQLSRKDYSGQSPMIRLALHNIQRTDGTGGNTWQQIRNVVAGLSDFFAPHNICFTVVSEDNITRSNFFTNPNATKDAIRRTNSVENAINIYFASNFSGGEATGFLFQDCNFQMVDVPTVVLGNMTGTSNTFNSSILAHELGHCLGLYHTHQASIAAGTCGSQAVSCLEQIPRTGNLANCDRCGDFLCDTPADPGLDFGSEVSDNLTCLYNGGASLNGVLYNPNATNIMSYSFPDCMTMFSPGQGNRMRNFILNTTFFDAYVGREDINLSGNFSGSRYYGAENNIFSSAISTIGQHTYEAGNSVVLTPGFDYSPIDVTDRFVADVELYSCTTPLVRNSGKREIVNLPKDDVENVLEIYPNPSNGVVNISFFLTEDETVQLFITDILGRRQAVYRQEHQGGDTYSTTLDLSAFASGTYFVTLVTGSFQETQKLIIQ